MAKVTVTFQEPTDDYAASNQRMIKFKLEEYLKKNDMKIVSDYFVAQYNSPWMLPPFRRNEIIVSIK